MNGSSPTDWLFASSHLSVNKNNDSPLRLFSKGSQFAVPSTVNLVDDSYKLAETIIGYYFILSSPFSLLLLSYRQ